MVGTPRSKPSGIFSSALSKEHFSASYCEGRLRFTSLQRCASRHGLPVYLTGFNDDKNSAQRCLEFDLALAGDSSAHLSGEPITGSRARVDRLEPLRHIRPTGLRGLVDGRWKISYNLTASAAVAPRGQ